ncbi:MAG: penicillin-binding protein 2 [Thermotogae bacterium]|nr:penicillin-binding protein 2 [Thermotogota bacterium]
MERKFKIMIIVVLIIFSLFELRLFQLQVIEGNKYREMLEDYMTKIENIPAPRGRIYDRNGILIADSIPMFNLYVDLRKYHKASIEEKNRFMAVMLNINPNLKENLEGLDVSKNQKVIFEKLDIEQFRTIKNYINEFSFLSYDKFYVRKYYGPKSLCHVVGYTDQRGQGKNGIEKEYNYLLKGKDGSRYIKTDAYGNEIGHAKIVEPIPGKDLYLTIDTRLQKELEKLLMEINQPSCAIALNPSNGEILAMVSYPYFDANIFLKKLTSEEWEKLSNDPQHPLLNRCISSSYLPGSIIKPFTALTALYYDLVDPFKIWHCTGKYEITSKNTNKVIATYKDWVRFGHGDVNLIDALKVSCNTYFYNLGVRIGIQTLSEFANLIGLDQKTGIDLPGEIAGLYPSIDWKRKRLNEDWYIGDTVLISIGQGYVSLTPLEITMLYSLIATEGKIFQPHVLKEVVSKSIPENHEMVKIKLIRSIQLSKEKWNVLKEGLKKVVDYPGTNVVDRGTAYEEFKGFKYSVAGKTGTAEISNDEPTHAWFACFSPIKKPSVVFVVFVDRGGYGGHVAAPIARKFLEYYYELNK